MKTLTTILKYLSAVLVIVIFGGLAGWYLYLRSLQNDAMQASGSSSAPGSFEGGASGSAGLAGQQASGVSSANASTSALWEVDSAPVSGMHFVQAGSTTALYYVERANGYLFSADPAQRAIRRLTDTLMPKVYEARFADNGSVIERFIAADGSVATFVGRASVSTSTASGAAPDSMSGSYLPKNILSIAVNPTTGALFYLTQNAQGGVTGTSENGDGTKQKAIFSSAIGSWIPRYLPDGRIIVQESPADGMPGYAYVVSASGLTPLVRGINGLTVLPASGSNALLYGSSENGSLTLYAAAPNATPTTVRTVADKCVWLPGASLTAYCASPASVSTPTFLNDWYRGAVHTADAWWKINAADGSASQLTASAGASLDVQDPTVDPSGTYIAFINAKDQSLWVMRVAQ